MAQETQIGALYQPRGVGCGGKWEGGSKGRGYMYTYGWFMLRFDRKQQNSVKQSFFNKKLKKKKKGKHLLEAVLTAWVNAVASVKVCANHWFYLQSRKWWREKCLPWTVTGGEKLNFLAAALVSVIPYTGSVKLKRVFVLYCRCVWLWAEKWLFSYSESET